MKKLFLRMLCFLLGHKRKFEMKLEPEGDLYRCERCGTLLMYWNKGYLEKAKEFEMRSYYTRGDRIYKGRT